MSCVVSSSFARRFFEFIWSSLTCVGQQLALLLLTGRWGLSCHHAKYHMTLFLEWLFSYKKRACRYLLGSIRDAFKVFTISHVSLLDVCSFRRTTFSWIRIDRSRCSGLLSMYDQSYLDDDSSSCERVVGETVPYGCYCDDACVYACFWSNCLVSWCLVAASVVGWWLLICFLYLFRWCWLNEVRGWMP